MSNALCDGVWHTGNCDFFRQKSRGLVKLGAIRFIDSRANAYAERGASEFIDQDANEFTKQGINALQIDVPMY